MKCNFCDSDVRVSTEYDDIWGDKVVVTCKVCKLRVMSLDLEDLANVVRWAIGKGLNEKIYT